MAGLLDALMGRSEPQPRTIPLLSMITGNPVGTETTQGMGVADPGFQPGVQWGEHFLSRPHYDAAQNAMSAAMMFGMPEYKAYKGMYPYDWRLAEIRNGAGIPIENIGAKPPPLSEINNPDKPYAGFFSDSPDVANRFAGISTEGAVFPSRVNFDNPLTIDAKGKPAAAFQFESIAREHGTQGDYQAFQNAWKADSPYDGVILKNTKDEGTVYVPRNPSQIRSDIQARAEEQSK